MIQRDYLIIGSGIGGSSVCENIRKYDKRGQVTLVGAETYVPYKRWMLSKTFLRDKVPPEVFTTVYTNPVNGTPENVRNNLREALRLLREAGYEVRNQRLVNARTGEPFTCELLVEDPSYERFILFYKPSLERLGISITLRIVDDAQYQNRIRTWDYDIIVAQWPQSLSPGNEQRDFWSSTAADRIGSRNYAGIKNPAVDALIEHIIFAKGRAELIAATRALDRVPPG